MKLKELYKQMKDEQQQPQVNLEEVKTQFNEAIKEFKNHAATLYNMGKYREIAEYFTKLAENAEHYIMSENSEGKGFDDITVKRNLKELRSYANDFVKVSGEAQAVQERMAALYEDMGVILNRYFDIPESMEPGNQEPKIEPSNAQLQSAEKDAEVIKKNANKDIDKLRQSLSAYGDDDELDETHMTKPEIKKGHEIAKAVKKSGSDVENPYAVGMAAVKKMKGKEEMDEKKLSDKQIAAQAPPKDKITFADIIKLRQKGKQ